MTDLILVPQIYYNVKRKNAACDGVTDDTAAINNAISAVSAAGGGYVFLPGVCAISAPLTMPANTWLIGAGPGTGLKALAGFVGAEMVSITHDWCGVRDIQLIGGPNNASASNPAITACIEISAARLAGILNCEFYYINGWCIESIGGSSVNNVGSRIIGNHEVHCAQGLHIKGNSLSNYVGQMQIVGNLFESIDNGDLLFLEDINDCQIVGLGGAVAGGATSGAAIHVKGGASNTFTNIDVGMLSTGTVSPTILLETSGVSGDPNNITFVGGVAQNGNNALQVTAANNVKFTSMLFKHANLDGVNISGALSGPITFKDCNWNTNNQANSTAYDVNNSQSNNFAYFEGCIFQSQVAGGIAGSVTNVANDANHKCFFFSCHFAGSGTSPSNVFAGTPQIVRQCIGYNPRGNITAPIIGASPATINTSQHDVEIIFLTIGGMTAFKVGGIAVGVLPVAGMPYHVPARTSLEVDWATTAPTWQWFAD